MVISEERLSQLGNDTNMEDEFRTGMGQNERMDVTEGEGFANPGDGDMGMKLNVMALITEHVENPLVDIHMGIAENPYPSRSEDEELNVCYSSPLPPTRGTLDRMTPATNQTMYTTMENSIHFCRNGHTMAWMAQQMNPSAGRHRAKHQSTNMPPKDILVWRFLHCFLMDLPTFETSLDGKHL